MEVVPHDAAVLLATAAIGEPSSGGGGELPQVSPARSSAANTHAALPVVSSGGTHPAMMDTSVVPVGSAPVLGSPDALVTVVAFGDYQCPFCRRVESTLRALRARYGPDIRFVWRNNPLPFHPHAELAALAAIEVYAQLGAAGFWQFHHRLFDSADQPGALERPALEALAAQIGVDLQRFRASLAARTRSTELDADRALAAQLGLNGAPSFMINGTRFVGAQPEERFVEVIDRILARARTIRPRERVYVEMVSDPEPGIDPSPPPARADSFDTVHSVRASPGAPALGPSTAPVTIEVFSDFQCPFCARLHPRLEAIVQHFQGRVRLVHRDYPLPFHPHARGAAEVAREVHAQLGDAAYFRFIARMYAQQTNLDSRSLETLAVSMGANRARLRRALATHAHAAGIQFDETAFNAVNGGSGGTPTMFINGHMLSGLREFDEIRQRIDRLTSQPSP